MNTGFNSSLFTTTAQPLTEWPVCVLGEAPASSWASWLVGKVTDAAPQIATGITAQVGLVIFEKKIVPRLPEEARELASCTAKVTFGYVLGGPIGALLYVSSEVFNGILEHKNILRPLKQHFRCMMDYERELQANITQKESLEEKLIGAIPERKTWLLKKIKKIESYIETNRKLINWYSKEVDTLCQQTNLDRECYEGIFRKEGGFRGSFRSREFRESIRKSWLFRKFCYKSIEELA